MNRLGEFGTPGLNVTSKEMRGKSGGERDSLWRMVYTPTFRQRKGSIEGGRVSGRGCK